MKSLIKFLPLFCSVLATLSLAAGLSQIAAKLDPVSQKAKLITSFDNSVLPDRPCISCIAL